MAGKKAVAARYAQSAQYTRENRTTAKRRIKEARQAELTARVLERKQMRDSAALDISAGSA